MLNEYKDILIYAKFSQSINNIIIKIYINSRSNYTEFKIIEFNNSLKEAIKILKFIDYIDDIDKKKETTREITKAILKKFLINY